MTTGSHSYDGTAPILKRFLFKQTHEEKTLWLRQEWDVDYLKWSSKVDFSVL